jgi:cell wall-associated NlpC family hydrolase/3D (Asp-Asp-Asp) domain-containing protein
MKIRKVDEKPMDIHRKKAPKIHVVKKAKAKKTSIRVKRNPVHRRNSLSERRKNSDASIKIRQASLHVAGKAGKKTMEQLEGGEEVRESALLMGAAAMPVITAAGKGMKLAKRRRKLKQTKQAQQIKKKSRSHQSSSSPSSEMQRRKAAVKARDGTGQTGKKTKKLTKSGKLSGRNRMLAAFFDGRKKGGKGGEDFSFEQNQPVIQRMKQAVMLMVSQVFALLGPVLLVLFLIVAVAAVIIVAVLYVIYNSPLAIFFPLPDTGYDSPQTVLTQYYQEFNSELSALEEKGYTITYQNEEDGVASSNYNDTLMVYMVKYGNGQAGYVMDDTGKANLKTVFEEMNYYQKKETSKTIKAGEYLGKVVTSGYCGCKKCNGESGAGKTASGVKPKKNHTIAVDKNNPIVPVGTEVVIGSTTYKVEDTGDFAKYGVDFDIYFDDHETAQNWGHKTFKCYLADDKAKGKQKDKKKSNDVKVTTRDVTVHNLTWQDYVNAGTLSEDEVSLLTDMMNGDYRISSGSSAGETVALMAQTKVGCRYSQDKRMEEGYYDCSSLVYRLYAEAGISLPSIAAEQGKYCHDHAMLINKKELQPGDLIFYSYEENGRYKNISHVAIYVGNGKMVHAANTKRGVVMDDLSTGSVVFYARPY